MFFWVIVSVTMFVLLVRTNNCGTVRLIKNTENSEDLKALANNDNDIVNTGIRTNRFRERKLLLPLNG